MKLAAKQGAKMGKERECVNKNVNNNKDAI
jgi:hypothetical protein